MRRNSIDLRRLKRDLMDYYGTAAHSGFDMAIRAGFDIEDYQEEDLEI